MRRAMTKTKALDGRQPIEARIFPKAALCSWRMRRGIPRLELIFQNEAEWSVKEPRRQGKSSRGLRVGFASRPQVIMSSSQRPGNEVATSSLMKRVRSGMYHLHLQFPRAKQGGLGDSLAHEFPHILRLIRELGMDFIFAEPKDCNLHMVREFYANWEPEARSHYVTVQGRNVLITPSSINDILGSPHDTDRLVLTGLNIRHPYRAIRHTLCGPQSMSQWTKHSGNRYHQSLPYAHMLRETRVWLKVVMNCLIPGLHYTDITRDMVFLVYALMTGTELKIRTILKSAIQKARVHKGHKYDFGGLITKMCRAAGVPEENLDYMAPLYPTLVDITRTKGLDTDFGPTLTTVERHRRDELILARM
ncbi:hypothetical protein KY285_035712 [Solanum tuberosum]|nr:hypothetical protein KY289_035926 [Solanum tuberosum]KAH0639126.1 hypothetical protein KY285_035712 [Solanum tuberosum]